MKTKVQNLIVACIIPLIFVSCSVGKHAYEGPKRSVSELATIDVVPTENSQSTFGSHKEQPHVTHVDDLQVGSYSSTFPKKIYVLPGVRKIRTEYFSTQSTKSAASNIGGLLGGAIGGAIGASIDRARNADLIAATRRETKVTVKAGKGYLLRAKSSDGKGTNLRVWIEDAPASAN